MVISYHQNLHLRVHYKNNKTLETKSQFISSYFDTKNNSHNNMDIEFFAEVCVSLFYYKHESKYNKIPCFVEMKIKRTNKICDIS
jgi:general stress protein 26